MGLWCLPILQKEVMSKFVPYGNSGQDLGLKVDIQNIITVPSYRFLIKVDNKYNLKAR